MVEACFFLFGGDRVGLGDSFYGSPFCYRNCDLFLLSYLLLFLGSITFGVVDNIFIFLCSACDLSSWLNMFFSSPIIPPADDISSPFPPFLPRKEWTLLLS